MSSFYYNCILCYNNNVKRGIKMNLKVYDFYDGDMLFASYVFKFHRLYVRKGYLHRIDEIKRALADNGYIMLDWQEM